MSTNLAINGGEKTRDSAFPPWPHFFEDERAEVEQVLKEGKVNYWTGNRGIQFQERFAEYCGAKHGIAVMNGTAALHVALAAANIGPGDEVIVPPRTFVATAFSVMHQNAVPIFADVDPQSQNIDAEHIKKHITKRTKAIICVHLAGLTCDMGSIMELAREHKLVVIEDAAQAHGAEYFGKKTGNLGHIAAFSFCNDKHFTTGGEGGMVVTNDDNMAEIARSFKDHGYEERERRSLLELEALYTYIHHRMGFNYRMTEMQAAIGLKALEKLDWNINRRWENAHFLTNHLSKFEALTPPVEPQGYKHSFYKYYVRLDTEKLIVDRDTFVKAVRAEGVPIGLGSASESYRDEAFQKLIGYGITSCPFTCPWYEGVADYSEVSMPNAQKLGNEVFVLQVHPTIETNDLKDVVKAIEKVLDAYAR
jgi:dTDP-4-amino-4,6-dideoxygalactose transaminase